MKCAEGSIFASSTNLAQDPRASLRLTAPSPEDDERMSAYFYSLRKNLRSNLSPPPKPPAYSLSSRRDWQGLETHTGGSGAEGSSPGRQRYQRAWGSLPAVSGPLSRGVAVQLPLQLEMHGTMVGSRIERTFASFQVAMPGNAGSAAARCRTRLGTVTGRRRLHPKYI